MKLSLLGGLEVFAVLVVYLVCLHSLWRSHKSSPNSKGGWTFKPRVHGFVYVGRDVYTFQSGST